MSRSAVFYVVLVSFVLGVALGTFLYGMFLPVAFLVLGVGAAMWGAWSDRRGTVFFLVASVFCLGLIHSGREESFWRGLSRIGTVSGTAEVVRKPESGDFSKNVTVRMRSCDGDLCPEGQIRARFPILEEVSFGDVGKFSCDATLPDEAWRMYFAKEGISHVCANPKWERLGKESGPLVSISGFSDRFESSLGRALPEPESGLAMGILLGGDGRLPRKVQEDFRNAGLAHIVAVSGYNISIVAEYLLLLGIVFFLPRRGAAIGALLGSVAFVCVSGAPPSSVRAVGMASALVLAWILGRRYASLHAVLFASVVMLIGNPLLIRHDLGFLLSFAATSGIILASPVVGRLLQDTRSVPRMFLEGLFLTVAAEAAILPIVFSNFGHFSLMTFPANALLLPLVPLAMLFSFLSGFFGIFSETIGSVLGFPAYVFLHAIVSGASYAASFTSADITWDSFGWTASAVWYVTLGGVFVFVSRTIMRRRAFSPRGNRDNMMI